MKKQVQVKGTLPLIAQFFDTSEMRIFNIFGLNLSTDEVTESKAVEINPEKGKLNEKKTTNKSKTIRTSNKSI